VTWEMVAHVVSWAAVVASFVALVVAVWRFYR
jgi:hypothetical protein